MREENVGGEATTGICNEGRRQTNVYQLTTNAKYLPTRPKGAAKFKCAVRRDWCQLGNTHMTSPPCGTPPTGCCPSPQHQPGTTGPSPEPGTEGGTRRLWRCWSRDSACGRRTKRRLRFPKRRSRWGRPGRTAPGCALCTTSNHVRAINPQPCACSEAGF